jgi:selenide,water dikinase
MPLRLVLVGGGHSHVEVLRSLGLQRRSAAGAPRSSSGSPAASWPADLRVTLVSRSRWTPYSGMLPGWAAGHYSLRECHIDLQRLADFAGAKLLVAEAHGLDTQVGRSLGPRQLRAGLARLRRKPAV